MPGLLFRLDGWNPFRRIYMAFSSSSTHNVSPFKAASSDSPDMSPVNKINYTATGSHSQYVCVCVCMKGLLSVLVYVVIVAVGFSIDSAPIFLTPEPQTKTTVEKLIILWAHIILTDSSALVRLVLPLSCSFSPTNNRPAAFRGSCCQYETWNTQYTVLFRTTTTPTERWKKNPENI